MDKRAAPRFDVVVRAEAFVDGHILLASTRNLSLGGVGLLLDRRLEPAAQVGLKLYLVVDGIEDALTAQLALAGLVAWSAESQPGTWIAGVKFEDLDIDRKMLIERFLRSLKP